MRLPTDRRMRNREENIDRPLAPFMYTISCMPCVTVSLAFGGAGLRAMWGEQMACQMLGGVGLTRVAIAQISADTGSNYAIATKR